MKRALLQVALDLVELDRAVRIGEEAKAGGADWLEVGTPLIKSEGMTAVSRLKTVFPGMVIVADMKTADTGALEVEMAAKAGADVVCVLASSDDAVIRESVRAARKYGVKIMGDLLSVPDPVSRGVELEAAGVDVLSLHVGIDQQMTGREVSEHLRELAGRVSIPVAAAGGLDATRAAAAVADGASVVIVGGAVIRADDVTAAAREVREAIDTGLSSQPTRPDPESEIFAILSRVSSPNVSDAMHRKGAMAGIVPICPGTKAVGKALTVWTIGGDWAKPVEAIDQAGPGDVLVISNDQCTRVAPWGELATHSCLNRKIEGVIIDGAVRDLDDIRALHYPVWATATVPNAGEPKGFGEIGAEITCCGQVVRTGDWIVADESGVVVIPKEHAYEIARRSLLVKETEERIRAEIRAGKTLSQVMNLLRWEKH